MQSKLLNGLEFLFQIIVISSNYRQGDITKYTHPPKKNIIRFFSIKHIFGPVTNGDVSSTYPKHMILLTVNKIDRENVLFTESCVS